MDAVLNVQPSSALLWIALLPLLGAAANLLVWPSIAGLTRSRVPRWLTLATAIGSVVAAFAVGAFEISHLFDLWKVAHHSEGLTGGLYQKVYRWITVGSFQMAFELRLDTLTAVMVMVVTFVGSLIHVYSAGYMKGDARERTYFGYLNLFMGSMLILVLADNLLVMFIGWEGVGLCSYLLIGFWFEKEAYAYAGRKAFIVNRIGDFSFILGICLLFWATGHLNFRELASPDAVSAFHTSFWGGERLAMWAGLLLFIGACGKSAQIPLYVWLPDAMAGPTPVSALIHAATMVTAGVYMIARLSFLFASSSTVMAIVAMVGALTALFAAIMAFAQTDLKKVLAYSTISQLGFMFCGVGLGAYVAGIFHLMTHAFFKAGLFLGAGSVMHAMSGSGDILKMGGLRKKLPVTHISFLIYCLAISGFPGFSGFFSKDEILSGAWGATGGPDSGWPAMAGGTVVGKLVWVILALAALGTAFYMFRLYSLVFLGECRADEETKKHIHESPASMTLPLVVLAVLAALGGVFGLPEAFAPSFLHEWLSTSLVTGVAHEAFGHVGSSTTVILMGVATVIGLVGIFAAVALYRRGPSPWVARFTARGVGASLYDLSKNKFYVDETYNKYIVVPFKLAARWTFEVVDRFVIDFLIVDGSAFVVDTTGRVLRWLQNGQVQRYLVGLLLGGVLIFALTDRGGVDFDYQVEGGGWVSFDAQVEGPGIRGAELEWDFDGDGRIDSTDPEVRWRFGRTDRKYHVTLRLKDTSFGRWRQVTRTVDPGAAPADNGDNAGNAGNAAGGK